ncbi:hypothetical protein [Paenibacillus barengoltzii]|jgi:hypothetical protein|uniref:DUF4064 domain-containing protein n=1 Tax=Paenibacillus barengoltzii J12 TaxID=935846 RepID=A0ABY1LYZ2_9BACL|nr:hypothetical protein [Paenibacillus barengoltzii]SMF37785.1 hypothetical protein SAMN02744124_02691 [Paenibacillus barengoltzii J12]
MDHRQSEQDPVSPYFAPHEPMNRVKFSGPGIASFILSLVAVVGYIAALALIISTAMDLVDQPAEAIAADLMQRSGTVLGVLLFLISGVLDLVGLILGIVGLAIRNRRKVFAILGTIFSVLPLVLFIFLIVLGSLTG